MDGGSPLACQRGPDQYELAGLVNIFFSIFRKLILEFFLFFFRLHLELPAHKTKVQVYSLMFPNIPNGLENIMLK